MNGEPVPMGKTLGVISKLWEMTRRYTWVPVVYNGEPEPQWLKRNSKMAPRRLTRWRANPVSLGFTQANTAYTPVPGCTQAALSEGIPQVNKSWSLMLPVVYDTGKHFRRWSVQWYTILQFDNPRRPLHKDVTTTKAKNGRWVGAL